MPTLARAARLGKLTMSAAFLAAVVAVSLRAQDAGIEPKLPVKDWTGAQAHKALRVIDGDTVVIALDGKETKVRLIGVDTPETVHPNKPVERFGKEASKFTAGLLLGKSVYVEYDQTRLDRYGRTLAYLYLAPDGLFVNLEIVKQGFGHAYTKYPFKYMELFRFHERQSREAKRGLWGDALGNGKGAAPEAKGKDAGQAVGTVYVMNSGTKYHAVGCRHLAKSKVPVSLEDARKTHQPCAVCNPPR